MEYITAFVTGGLICAAVQILLDRTKMMPGRVMVLLVCSGAVLGFAGLYKPFQEMAGPDFINLFRRWRAPGPVSRCWASAIFSGRGCGRRWTSTGSWVYLWADLQPARRGSRRR